MVFIITKTTKNEKQNLTIRRPGADDRRCRL